LQNRKFCKRFLLLELMGRVWYNIVKPCAGRQANIYKFISKGKSIMKKLTCIILAITFMLATLTVLAADVSIGVSVAKPGKTSGDESATGSFSGASLIMPGTPEAEEALQNRQEIIEELGISEGEAASKIYQMIDQYRVTYNEAERDKLFAEMENIAEVLLRERNLEIVAFKTLKEERAGYTTITLEDINDEFAFYKQRAFNWAMSGTLYIGTEQVVEKQEYTDNERVHIATWLEKATIASVINNASKTEKDIFVNSLDTVKEAANDSEVGKRISELYTILMARLSSEGEESTGQALTEGNISFSDVTELDWFYNDVMVMASKGYVNGKVAPVNGVGMFYPQDTISRAEFVAIIMRIMHPEENFAVADGEKWWKASYEKAALLNYIEEEDIGKSPEQPMSREEMAYVSHVVLENCITVGTVSSKANIPDYNKIDARYADAALSVHGEGIIYGDENGYFNPKNNLTRAEASAVLNRLLQKIK